MKTKKRKLFPFIFLFVVSIILASHLLSNSQSIAQTNQPQCSISPFVQILKRDKAGKSIFENGKELTENKRISLKISEISSRENDDNLVNNNQKIATLGDRIRVTINGLSNAINKGFIYEFDQENQTKKLSPFLYQNLVLQLKGYPLNGLHPTRISNNKDQVEFKLSHFEESNEAWNSIFGSALEGERIVAVTVGCPDGESIPLDSNAFKADNNFNNIKIRLWQSLRGFIIILPVFILALSIIACITGPVLRVSGITENRSFSLARAQLAWWSYLIFFSFLGLFAITGNYSNIITSQSMILLGIGSGTTIASVLIDSGRQPNELELKKLQKELKEKQRQQPKKEEDLKKIKEEINNYELQSKGFFKDILTDSKGEFNLHRAQIFIWTIVLGLIFIYQVITNFKMPEFDATLLTLQGISSGTFLALKAQGEPKTPGVGGAEAEEARILEEARIAEEARRKDVDKPSS